MSANYTHSCRSCGCLRPDSTLRQIEELWFCIDTEVCNKMKGGK